MKKRCAAAVFLLKRLMVELIEPFRNCLVQLRQRKELPVPQCSEDECGDYSDSSLDHCFILGRSHATGQNCGIVMLGELGIGFVELDFILTVLIHAGLKIVALNDFSNAAKVLVGIYMRLCPAFLIHREESLYIRIAAEWQRCHENIYRNSFACIGIDDGSGVACPVNLHNLAWFVVEMHGRSGFRHVVAVILFKLSELIRNLSVLLAFLGILQPKQVQSYVAFEHFSRDIRIIGHFVRNLERSIWTNDFGELCVGHSFG